MLFSIAISAMLRRNPTAAMPPRAGFTLVEIMIVGGLMAFLAILLSSAWSGIVRSSANVAARSQLLQEMDLAVASLARDLGGSRPIPSSPERLNYGGKDDGRLIYCRPNDTGDMLELHYENVVDSASPALVRYYLIDDPDENVPTKLLVRSYAADAESEATVFPVARCVNDGGLSIELDGGWTVILLTFTETRPHAAYTRTCTLKAKCLPE